MASDEEGAYMREVREILRGQWAPPALDGGRRVLFRCDHCGRVWLQEGARVALDLSPSEIARLCLELDAHPSELPRATCHICAAQAIGVVELDEFRTGARIGGYGVNVEGTTPPGMHLMLGVFSLDWLQSLRSAPRAGIVTDFAKCRALVAWSGNLAFPAIYHTLTRAEAATMAEHNTPGHRAPGTERFAWQGGDWTIKCPPLGGGWARVSLAQAMPSDEAFSFRFLFKTWQALAPQLLAGKIAGEPED